MEAVVVVVLIAVLAALALPSMPCRPSRHVGMGSLSRLKDLSAATLVYAAANNEELPQEGVKSATVGLHWRIQKTPMLGTIRFRSS